MRILFLTHSFNSLAQRLYLELTHEGHEVAIEFDIHDEVTIEAVRLFDPDLVIAPFLKRAIPETVWKERTCLVVHPGVRGDRGPSSLDWAILEGEKEWGVTVLQANAEMDAGDIWAERGFPMRLASKSSLYRNEVTEVAVSAVLEAVTRIQSGGYRPEKLDLGDPRARGRLRPLMTQAERAIDWERDESLAVLRKIHASDGTPGVRDRLLEQELFLFNARSFGASSCGVRPGQVLGRSAGGALLRATRDGAVWIGYARKKGGLKLPAMRTLGLRAEDLPEVAGAEEIRFERRGPVGLLHFDFYNGAMSTQQCLALRDAVVRARASGVRVLALLGGEDFWSNGIHLHTIEAASSAADESWRNIEAMNDLTHSILTATDLLTVSAIGGNAGAGGVFLALASDRVFARSGVVLNPHYKAMGNLYGSEYWTYSLPKRVGPERARRITEGRLPLGAREALAQGLIDDHFGASVADFRMEVLRRCEALAENADFAQVLAAKSKCRAEDEAAKPLAAYREEEMRQMRLNFYGFDPSYHVARYNFVYRVPHSRTPRHLAVHRYGSR